MPNPLSRRDLLKGIGISGIAIGAASVVNVGKSGLAHGLSGHTGPITADWVKRENEYPGDFTWLKGPTTNSHSLCGYANSTSYSIGDVATFHFSATIPFVTAKLYRLGYYGGAGARLVHLFKNVPVQSQPTPSPDSFGTVDCNWPASLTVPIDGTFLPGQYLIKLVDDSGQYQFVPFMIRSHRSSATYLYMSSVTTWQAYNTFGGASLYRDEVNQVAGAGGLRAVRVSYNRPYVTAHGSADLLGLEYPLLYLCERDGLDMAYCTSIDIHSGTIQLSDHRTLLSLGHDEYYSKEMRAAVVSAISAKTNVAFLGSNYIYRRVRFEPDASGVANRYMVNYRTMADPAVASNPSLTTMNWQENPYAAAPSLISGASYGGINGAGSLHVENASSWLWKNTGIRSGELIPRALYGEFNNYSRNNPQPARVQVLAHSRVAEGYSDITYVDEHNRGKVFAANMGSWIPNLTNLIPVRFNRHVPIELSKIFEAATRNVLTRLV
jgi:hypothetical protein